MDIVVWDEAFTQTPLFKLAKHDFDVSASRGTNCSIRSKRSEVASSRVAALKTLVNSINHIPFDKLEFLDYVAVGGFGTVYKGKLEGQLVAIKKLHLVDGGLPIRHLRLLQAELEALFQVKHENCVRFLGASFSPMKTCIVTEFLEGGSLYEYLGINREGLEERESYKLAIQVTKGLEFIHSINIIHRDLKPLNVILDINKNAKICDFGLAASMENVEINLPSGTVGGSPRYMAPECFVPGSMITEKVDIWSLGCILVEIFGGDAPYPEYVNVPQIVNRLLNRREPPFLPLTFEPPLRNMVKKCWYFPPLVRASASFVLKGLIEQNEELE